MEMRQATKIAEFTILVVALIISVVADTLPVVGRIAGKFAGRLYRNRYRAVAWLKIAYGWLRWGRFGRIYTSNYLLADYDPDFIRDFSVDNHCRMMARKYRGDRERALKLYGIRAYRRLTALYRAIYGIIAQWLIAQSGVPVEIPDPRVITAERNRRIRAIMANY